jgi:hypothetical protein
MYITGFQEDTMAQRFSRPAVGGGHAFALYSYGWSEIGAKVRTKRVAVGALKALYGAKAAAAAIREAQRISGRSR